MCALDCALMDVPPPILRNSPLRTVAIELRFPDVILVPDDLKAIRRGLVDQYPDTDTEQGIAITLSSEGAMSQQQAMRRQIYRTSDRTHQIALTSTALALEAIGPHYEGFEHFLDLWLDAVKVVAPVVDLRRQLRIGMRYINQLEVAEPEPTLRALDGRVNPALLSPAGADLFEFEIVSSLQELRLRTGRGPATLRHGLQIPPSGVPGSPPPGVYVLDIDCYDDQPAPFEDEEHKAQLKSFNAQIWRLFRWSITDDEYERMQPQERS